MAHVVPLWQIPSVPVAGSSDLFPVRRIYCVGRNYAGHAREMGFDPASQPPFFFSKPADAIVICTDQAEPIPVPYLPATKDLYYEMELVAALNRGGADIKVEDALSYVFGYAPDLDMMRRDLQDVAREGGQPWDMAKGFDCSAPIGAIKPSAQIGHPVTGRIQLKVNDKVRQSADLSELIWIVAKIISNLSRLVTLAAGDLIYSGTPEGVGSVFKGDRLEGKIQGVGKISCVIA